MNQVDVKGRLSGENQQLKKNPTKKSAGTFNRGSIGRVSSVVI